MAARADQMVETNTGAIEARSIVKSFTGTDNTVVAALNDFTLNIQPGQFVSLVGPSGCGKTTFLRLLCGLDQPDNGELLLDGRPITGPHHTRGLVFQNPRLYPWLTVYGNVAFGLKNMGQYHRRKHEVYRYIEMVGLAGFEKNYPHHLSGGMAQRAALARALITRPEVLSLDEPFGALDAFTRTDMQEELMQIWRDRKITMVMVTHDVEEALYLSDRIVIMSPRPGRINSILDISLPRKRDRSTPKFIELKDDILKRLHSGTCAPAV
jgi:ABC-type nitrate/sulfonate/bicarbonate transport system ATPase subunit